MIRLKVRDNYFKIIDGYQVNEASREVKFSSLKVDFTNKTIADLPLKYQECQLVERESENILPSGYTQVDYIESSGTQYIDTGVNADSKLRVVLDTTFLNSRSIGAIYRNGSNYERYHLQGEAKFIFYTHTTPVSLNTFDNNRHLFDLNVPNGTIYVDNISYNKEYIVFDTRLSFWLFRRNSNDSSLQFFNASKLYSCKMYYNNVLVRNFIPCYRNSDNEVGLYDLVNNVFYANQGTGEFTYGTKIESENNIIYTGYVNNFTLPKMKNRNEYRELELDLLSPLAMATVRTVDAVGTYELQSLVRELIQPLIDDGFVLKEMNIGNNQITVNFLSETVESSLNKLSNKFNFWWYIDANKNIYINSITYLMGLKPKLTYDDSNPIKGLIDVIPSIDATDYCNVVNFTNVRMYTDSFLIWDYYSEDYDNKIMTGFYPLFEKSVLNNGDEIEFNYPIDISSKATVTMANYSNGFHIDNTPLAIFEDSQDHGTYPRLRLYLDENNNVVIPSDATISDSYSDENTWVLVRDSFFNNLIVGLKYNGESFNIKVVSSLTALIWAKVKVQDNIEINKNKGLISQTGIVEKQIDMNETWKTYNELIEIANSYIKKNSSKVDTVKLNVDYDVNLNIGDTIKINKDYFLIDDVYIITDKTSTYEGNVKSWSYTLKNTNILENYVDLFRASENQDDEQKKINLITSDYIEEGFQERYEVVVNES